MADIGKMLNIGADNRSTPIIYRAAQFGQIYDFVIYIVFWIVINIYTLIKLYI